MLSGRKRAGALERRPRRARIDVAVEGGARRHHLEQADREIQPRSDDDIGSPVKNSEAIDTSL